MPHSRHNGLPGEALRSCGYRLLSWSDEAGADLFVAERASLFLFVQGHPEYDPLALYREYRRDVKRFLAGETPNYPELPRGYFDPASEAAFVDFRARAIARRDAGLIGAFPAIAETAVRSCWREPARQLYANWLSYLAQPETGARRPERWLTRQRESVGE